MRLVCQGLLKIATAHSHGLEKLAPPIARARHFVSGPETYWAASLPPNALSIVVLQTQGSRVFLALQTRGEKGEKFAPTFHCWRFALHRVLLCRRLA